MKRDPSPARTRRLLVAALSVALLAGCTHAPIRNNPDTTVTGAPATNPPGAEATASSTGTADRSTTSPTGTTGLGATGAAGSTGSASAPGTATSPNRGGSR